MPFFNGRNLVLKQKCAEYAERHDKIVFKHANAQPHVTKLTKEILEALHWNIFLHHYIYPMLLLQNSDCYLFAQCRLLFLEKGFLYAEITIWLDDWIVSKWPDMEFVCCLTQMADWCSFWQKIDGINIAFILTKNKCFFFTQKWPESCLYTKYLTLN